MFTDNKPIKVSRQENAFALTACFGFDYKGFRLFVVELILEVFGVLG
jgi:hypothetical protein